LSTCTEIFSEGIHFCGELSVFVFVFVFAAAAATAVAGMTERRIVSDGLLTFSL
jgi:hypothetical protein